MLDSLITSKTRIKLLLKFFLNINNTGYLRSLEHEFNESTNGIRQELNRFEQAGLLLTETERNKKIYRANTQHPLFRDLHSIIRKFIGIEEVIDKIIARVGNVQQVYLDGQIAKGLESETIDLLITGQQIDREYLNILARKAEPLIGKRISYVILGEEDAEVYVPKHSQELMLVYDHTAGQATV